jgi:hypothetical protein
MKTNIYIWTSIQIILIGGVIMILSFIPEMYPTFFGDVTCNGGRIIYEPEFLIIGCDKGNGTHLSTTHWGYRHWVWMFTGLVLCIVNIARVIVRINKNINESQ